jgi:radical SAM superfamily enzyme YgiQ (UPF0313 family)
MSGLRTLLLHPPSTGRSDSGAGARHHTDYGVHSQYYPTWLAQAAALIESSKLIDAAADGLSMAQVTLLAKGFELCIIHTSAWSFKQDAEMAASIKAAYPDIRIGLVGPYAEALPQAALEHCPSADFAAREEYDYALLEISQGLDYSDVLGISYRAENTIRHNRTRPSITDMDALPDVLGVYKRDLTPANYSVGWLRHPFISLYTGRGCGQKCSFCLWPQTVGGRPYRAKSADVVIAEVEKARRMFPETREFFFADDTFTEDLDRAERIAKGLGTLGVTWSCNARPDVPAATLKVFKDNGLRLLSVGYESADPGILAAAGKDISPRAAHTFTQQCRALGIRVHGHFILGLPGETRQTLADTARYACDLDVDSIIVSVAAAYPGTTLYKEAREKGWLSPNGIAYDHLDGEDLVRAMFRMYTRFYLRPHKLLRLLKIALRDPRQRQMRMRAGRAFLRFLWEGPDPYAQVFYPPEGRTKKDQALV